MARTIVAPVESPRAVPMTSPRTSPMAQPVRQCRVARAAPDHEPPRAAWECDTWWVCVEVSMTG